MYHYTEEQSRKEHFVIYYLDPLLHEAVEDIMNVKYIATEEGERVRLEYKNKHVVFIDVTADSSLALVGDVINRIMKEG